MPRSQPSVAVGSLSIHRISALIEHTSPRSPPEVRLRNEFRASLGRSVRVGGFQHVIFEHGFLVVLSFSVDLVGGHVNKPLDAHLGRTEPYARVVSEEK